MYYKTIFLYDYKNILAFLLTLKFFNNPATAYLFKSFVEILVYFQISLAIRN